MLFRTLVGLCLALSLLLSSCSRDPEVRKKKHLANGNRYFDNGKYREASIMYRNALKEDARFGEAHYRLAQTELKLGRIGEAISAFERAVELQPDNLDAYRQLSDFWLVALNQNPRRFAKLRNELQDLSDRLEKRAPNSYESLRLRGLLAQHDKKAEESITLFQAADKAKPNQPDMQATIASNLWALGRKEEAEQALLKLLSVNETFLHGYDLLYSIYASMGRIEDAERIANLRVANNPAVIDARMLLAVHYHHANKADQREKVLRDVLNDETTFQNGYEKVAEFYRRIGDVTGAVNTLQQGIQKSGVEATKKKLQTQLVLLYSVQGKIAEAQTHIDQMLKEDPKDPSAIAIRARLWLLGGRPDMLNAAITDLQAVVSKLPKNPVLRFDLGRALLLRGDIDNARAQLREALKIQPDYLPARLALAHSSLRRQEWTSALQLAAEVLEQDPANVQAKLVRSHAFLAQGDLKQARLVVDEVLQKTPDFMDAQYQLAFISYREKRYSDAEAYFKKVYYNDPPDLRGFMGMIEAQMAQGNFDEAIRAADAEIARFPKGVPYKVAKGTILIRAGKLDEALGLLRGIASSEGEVPDLHMRLAEALRLKGDNDGAIASWKRASELAPKLVAPVLNRAMMLDALNRRAEARPLYEQALRLEPENPLILNNLAYALADEGINLDAALTMAQRARQKAPHDPTVADTLGWIYVKKGLANNAISIFDELTSKYPAVATFHIHRASALVLRGDKAEAKKSLEAAKRNKPSKQELEQLQKLAGQVG